jgi:transposase
MNDLNFEGQNIYAGFDVHLKSWQVTILTDGLNLKTFVMPPKPEVLNDYLRKNYPGATYHSAYEAGFSGLWAHYRLCNLGIHNIVANAADIPSTQKDRLQKEDRRDSRKIANALRSGTLTPIYTPSESTLNDRSLIRSRRALVRDLVRFKLRIKSFLYFYGIEYPQDIKASSKYWTNRFMDWIGQLPMQDISGRQALDILVKEAKIQKQLLKDVTCQIKQLSQSERYCRQAMLLRSVPGIALINAMVILTEVEDISRFPNAERFASFIGLVPMSKSSGEKEKVGEITLRAHDFLRCLSKAHGLVFGWIQLCLWLTKTSKVVLCPVVILSDIL